jgi:hypothetical protein
MPGFAPKFRSSRRSHHQLNGLLETGEPMPNRTYLFQQLHVWAVLVGSAAIAALLANVFDGASPSEPRYTYESMDGSLCLVEEGSSTFVGRADGAPECVNWTTSPRRMWYRREAGEQQTVMEDRLWPTAETRDASP